MFIESKTEREHWNHLAKVLQAIENVAAKYRHESGTPFCWECSVSGVRDMHDWLEKFLRRDSSAAELLVLQEKIKEAEEQGLAPTEKTKSELIYLRAQSTKVIEAPKFDGFWSEVLEIFGKEGINTEDFLQQMRLENQGHAGCVKLDWIVGWLYQNIR